MDNSDCQTVIYSCLFVAVSIYFVRWYNDPLRAIPTVGGSSLPGLCYLGAWRMLGDCREELEEGYRKYPNSAFKVATLDKWVVVVSGRKMVEELRRRGDEELSNVAGIQESIQMRYTLEPALIADRYHADVIKEHLVQKLPAVLPGTIDEVAAAVKDHFVVSSEKEWTSIEVTPALQTIIARASNRTFVGLPLCRNSEYLSLAVHYAVGVVKSGLVLRLFPRFIKPLVALLINPLYVYGDTHRALAYLQPTVEKRLRDMAKFGEEWEEKPNDFLQSLLDKAATRNESTFVITQRLLHINFASIHTSSTTLSHALYQVAEKPELVSALREEIETAVAADGWTIPALGKMWKLDSLLRETLRYYGIGLLSMGRMAMKDLVLSDGTRIPRGTLIAASSYAMHHDDELLPDADVFDPFRFARMRTAERDSEGQGARHMFTKTSPEYIPFGHGPHSCPGRYFVANELKSILGYVLLNYDMKLGGDGARPSEVYRALGVIPAPRGCVLFRKRSREGSV